MSANWSVNRSTSSSSRSTWLQIRDVADVLRVDGVVAHIASKRWPSGKRFDTVSVDLTADSRGTSWEQTTHMKMQI